MRKIIESTLVSADGVVGSPPLWAMDYRDEEVTRDALERLSGSDAMLMGRGTYELFATIWPGQTDDFAQRINGIRKYVLLDARQRRLEQLNDRPGRCPGRGEEDQRARWPGPGPIRPWPPGADAAGERSDRRAPALDPPGAGRRRAAAAQQRQ